MTAEINSLENKIKYAEPQNSTKYSKQIDSLKEQYSHIKDGIEYIKLNDSEDYNNLINKQNICIFKSIEIIFLLFSTIIQISVSEYLQYLYFLLLIR